MKRWIPAIVALALLGAGAPARSAEEGSTVLFRGATIWTMAAEGVSEHGDLLVRDGKIAKIGRSIKAPPGAVIVDAVGMHLTPGLVDAHSHTAAEGGVNEGSNNVTAEVRIADVLDAEDIAIYRQLAGGLTVANVLHGSANSIGGQNAVIKLRWGVTAGDLLMEGAPPGIKFALGENPKRSNFTSPGGEERYPATRMGVAASIREAFLAAKDYEREWKRYESLGKPEKARAEPPRRDLQMDALVEVLNGTRLVHAHCYRQDEILMLIRLAEEFGFRIATFQHVLEGYKVAGEISAHGAGASTFSDWWAYKAEAWDAIPYNGALMVRRGVLVSFNSDSDELARRMNLEAAKAVKYGGLTDEEALALVTINPARQLRIDDRVGSLEAGKEADLALWSGHPLSTYTVCRQTWVDGVKMFDRVEDLAGREAAGAGRAALIERVREAAAASKKKGGDGEGGKKGDEGGKEEDGGGDEKESAPAPEPGPQPAGHPVRWNAPVAGAAPFALTGGTIHSVSGPVIERGTVTVRDGRIEAVGAAIAVPSDATVIDVSGLHVYPGLIDADTVLGLTEIGSVAGMNDTSETGLVNPDVRVDLAVNPDSELIPVTRANGITHVLSAPRGRVVSGSSALLRLDGWTWEDLSAASPLAMHVQWPEFRASFSFRTGGLTPEEELEKTRKEEREAIDGLLRDARGYRIAVEAAGGAGKTGADFRRDQKLEAMLPVLDGAIPVIVHADNLRQIEDALAWGGKESLRIVIAGGYDAWRVADRLAKREVPVILGPIHRNPLRRHEAYDVPFTAPRKLHEAGVTFCIGGGGSRFTASSTRALPWGAATAAAYGLPREEALRSVTLYPARILGVEEHLGSIEAGKSASLIVTDGDPLEIRTQVKRVFIDGRESDLTNRHRTLYERYAARPPSAREVEGRKR